MDGSGLCDYRVRSLALAESMTIKTVILHEQIIVSIRVYDWIFGNWKVEIKPPCATKSLSNLDPNHQVVSKEPVNWMLFTMRITTLPSSAFLFDRSLNMFHLLKNPLFYTGCNINSINQNNTKYKLSKNLV